VRPAVKVTLSTAATLLGEVIGVVEVMRVSVMGL
jgi:hypothetical protein